ncbi:MAG: hypothetical protein KAX99_07075 [Azonexus sp.]|nr:hypothetical protein [Azonexus sp.]
MIKLSLAATLALLLTACAGGPVQPDWQNDAHQSLNNFSAAYLSGNTRLAEAEFQRARSELTRTGRLDLVARAELVRCGVQVASLELDNCPGFAALASDAGVAERAYADFLQGKAVAVSVLPAQYRAVATKEKTAISTIDLPLSRLIAAGVLFRRGDLDTSNIAIAVETASSQGWRRALLAWLEIQAKQAESQGDQNTAAQARRRAELASGQR